MEFLEQTVGFLNDIIWSYILIVMLVGLGVVFSVKTKFVQIRLFKEMFRLLHEGVGQSTAHNQVSSFQAFCISTASRVGVGNIAGIAIAVATGGPGAVFWMWGIALLGAASGFVESTLAQIYKVPQEKGGFNGGPAYYIKNVLDQKWMAILFAILISVTFGLVFNSVQANTISLALNTAYGIDRMMLGVVLAALTGIVIWGGVARIAKVAEWIVPIMATVYILTAIVITVLNIALVPKMLYTIVSSAFSFDAAVGGGFGLAVMTGLKRGLFSNEAGMGSVPNAAATSNATHPVKQGLIQAFGVFVDTWLVCTATAFIVLLSPEYTTSTLTGIELAQASLTSHLGSSAPVLLAGLVCLFAFSSIIGNYCYGETNIAFMTENPIWLTMFRIFVVGMVLFGSIAKVGLVWDMADLFMGLMAITNLVAIALLAKYAYIALEDYTTQKKKGIIEPIFDVSIMPSTKGIYAWNIDSVNKKNKKDKK